LNLRMSCGCTETSRAFAPFGKRLPSASSNPASTALARRGAPAALSLERSRQVLARSPWIFTKWWRT